jgi:hypothetical protein
VKGKLVLILIVSLLSNTAFAYSGNADFPDLFKYDNQKNTNLETALQLISSSFNEHGVTVTRELLAAIIATLDKEVGVNYLPVEEGGDYGMGPSCTYKINGLCRSTPYDGGVDYKGRGYIQITHKYNYQEYCPDCVGTSAPELDVCGCKNQWNCKTSDSSTCPQVKALQPDYAADIFASYYINNDLVCLSNGISYNAVGKAINGKEAYAIEFNATANAYLTLFLNNPSKTEKLLAWLNSGSMAAVEAVSIGFPITFTLYVHNGDANGPVISGARVTGREGAGNNFEQTTNSDGYVTLTGILGTWSFSVSADGYETNKWDQEITDNCDRHAFLKEGSIVGNNVVGRWNGYNEPDPPGSCDGGFNYIIDFYDTGTFTRFYIDRRGEEITSTGEWVRDEDTIRLQYNPKPMGEVKCPDCGDSTYESSIDAEQEEGKINGDAMSGTGSISGRYKWYSKQNPESVIDSGSWSCSCNWEAQKEGT